MRCNRPLRSEITHHETRKLPHPWQDSTNRLPLTRLEYKVPVTNTSPPTTSSHRLYSLKNNPTPCCICWQAKIQAYQFKWSPVFWGFSCARSRNELIIAHKGGTFTSLRLDLGGCGGRHWPPLLTLTRCQVEVGGHKREVHQAWTNCCIGVMLALWNSMPPFTFTVLNDANIFIELFSHVPLKEVLCVGPTTLTTYLYESIHRPVMLASHRKEACFRFSPTLSFRHHPTYWTMSPQLFHFAPRPGDQ